MLSSMFDLTTTSKNSKYCSNTDKYSLVAGPFSGNWVKAILLLANDKVISFSCHKNHKIMAQNYCVVI